MQMKAFKRTARRWNCWSRKGSIVLATLSLSIILLAYYQIQGSQLFLKDGFNDIQQSINIKRQLTNKTNYITWYNPNIFLDGITNASRECQFFNSCEYSNCFMRFGKPNITESDAVIFDGRLARRGEFFQKKNGQIWIFSAPEVPPYYDLGGTEWRTDARWISAYNWTMTYDKIRSDIYLPYGDIRKRRTKVVKDYKSIFKKKKRTALIVHSHCPTLSLREQFVSKLQKHLDFDSFGACGTPWKCGRDFFHDSCFDIINSYHFYFAFENAICYQYFTEKLYFNFNYDSIMVVRGGRNDSNRFPPGSVIFTEDFPSITALAEYLKKLSNSEKLYTEFLRRKDQYYSVPFNVVYQSAMCELCEKMNKQDKYRKQIRNIVDWAYGQRACIHPNDLSHPYDG